MHVNKRPAAAIFLGLSIILAWLFFLALDMGRAGGFTTTALIYLPHIVKPVIPTPTPSPTPIPWLYARKAEYPDEYTVGKMIQRSNACGRKVHGQFGTIDTPPWSAKSGYAKYVRIDFPQADQMVLRFRYSKYSSAAVPILIYLDDEPMPRATYYPVSQGSWNRFAWTDTIALGNVDSGTHSIKFYTDGQQYGVADLDMFCLANYPLEVNKCSCY